MKRICYVFCTFWAVGLLVGMSGCSLPHGKCMTGLMRGSCQQAPENCAAVAANCQCDDPNGYPGRLCSHQRCRRFPRDPGCPVAAPAGAAITYPYYTVRGPRDFLARSPRPIGP